MVVPVSEIHRTQVAMQLQFQIAASIATPYSGSSSSTGSADKADTASVSPATAVNIVYGTDVCQRFDPNRGNESVRSADFFWGERGGKGAGESRMQSLWICTSILHVVLTRIGGLESSLQTRDPQGILGTLHSDCKSTVCTFEWEMC